MMHRTKRYLGRLGIQKSLLALFGLVLLMLAGVACGSGDASTFNTAGPVAERQGNLLYFVFFIAVAVFIIVEGLIIFISFKYRRRNDNIPEQVHGNNRLEILWTIIPAIIIIVIAVPTIQGIWALANPAGSDENPLEVEAIGHQWWFEFRYPDEQIITANELVVPTDRWVRLSLGSQDVIHSFWVPRLFGKRDMVPNQETTLWFRADEEGEYVGICAELCGIAHAKMQFRVYAMNAAEYERWSSDWFVAPDSAESGSDIAQGQLLFTQHCSTCHTINSYRDNGYNLEVTAQDQRWSAFIGDIDNGSHLPGGAAIVSAPNLTHLATRSTLGAGSLDLTRETLFDWIKNPSFDRNGNSVKPGTRMQNHAAVYINNLTEDELRDFQNPRLENFTVEAPATLTDGEIELIVDYLFSLSPGAQDNVSVLEESGT